MVYPDMTDPVGHTGRFRRWDREWRAIPGATAAAGLDPGYDDDWAGPPFEGPR
jgi:hypothetical protein